ncbi:hypothetical protein AB0K60_09630 [Thermopolyspora sp. NPDC052614]|uniref:hypothetical protein n=1 Tax=Thermopolyspora sp. NPDC052614 TaxID=3155682 RepID=UPI0034343F11
MEALISAMEDMVTVHYGQFLLADEDGAQGVPDDSPSPWELSFDENDWFQVTPNGALISTGYSDHRVTVRLELWGSPPPMSEHWDDVWEGDFYAGSGRIALATLLTDESHEVFDLGRRDSSWRLRAHVRQLRDTDDIDWETEGFPSGVEFYLLRFWLAT